MSAALLGVVAASGGGSGPSPYHADAVQFDASTYLSNAALVSTDNNKWSLSFWINLTSANFPELYVVDPTDSYYTDGFFSNGSDPQKIGFHLGNEQVEDKQLTLLSDAVLSTGVWYNFLMSGEIGADEASTKVAAYLNDAPLTLAQSGAYPSSILSNGFQFVFGGDTFGNNLNAAVADPWIAPGTSLIVGSDIPEATRRLFISASGKPVNPSGFPTSAVLFSGNAAAFGTNQGTGGSFTTTGTLTNASTSPSD